MRSTILLGVLSLTSVLACGGDGGPTQPTQPGNDADQPTVGSVQVTTSTTGTGFDPNGYTVRMDGSASQSVGVNGMVTFSSLEPGNHTVELTALGLNCRVSGVNPLTVSVTVGATAQATFDVVCVAYVTNVTGRVSAIATASNTVVVR